MINYSNERCIFIDESGNLGYCGRYFVIAFIDTRNSKALHNIMHTKLGVARKLFPELAKLHTNEIKAKDAYPCVKTHILESIVSKEVKIHYIVADLEHVKPKLLTDKNIFYNYMMKILLDKIITSEDNGSRINIICDNKSTKIASGNSFKDYITLHFVYDKDFDIKLNIQSLDSNASDAYTIQAADYVANAIWSYYEYNNDLYYNELIPRLNTVCKFPARLFAK